MRHRDLTLAGGAGLLPDEAAAAPPPALAEAALSMMPMHLLVSADGRVLSAGATLARLLQGQDRFDAAFDPIGPACIGDLARAERVFLRLRSDPARVLRGRGSLLADGAALFNLGFGIGLVDAVRAFDLTDRDFAPSDLAMELLFLHEANSAMTDELSRANLRLEEARSKAEAEAFTDPLTGLFNRRGLELSFAALRLGASIDLSQQFALVLMDLDHFKTLNDTHGHAAGDAMLREVAVRLNAATRAEDTIARTGGDEFVLLLPHFADAERLERLGQRIVASIEQPFDFNGTTCRISVSLGGALSTDYPCLDWAAMQAAADDALYRAKRAGRGCLRIAGHGSD